MSTLPPLPPGFKLVGGDEQSPSSLPPLPPGFTLEQPATPQQTQPEQEGWGSWLARKWSEASQRATDASDQLRDNVELIKEKPVEMLGGAARAAGQGLTLNTSDDIAAYVMGGLDPNRTVEDYQRHYDNVTRQDKENLGKAYTPIEMAGAVVPGAGVARAGMAVVPATASLGARVARNAASFGAPAAVQTYGSQEYDDKDVGSAVGTGLVMGTGAGAVTVAAPVLKKFGEYGLDRGRALWEALAVSRHNATNPGAPLNIPPPGPIRRALGAKSMQEKAAGNIVDELERNHINARTYRSQSAAAALPGEGRAVPGVSNDVVQRFGLQSAENLPGAQFGGRGDIAENFRNQSLMRNGVSESDLVKQRLLDSVGRRQRPEVTAQRITDTHAAVGRELERIKGQGGNTRVPGISTEIAGNDYLDQMYENAARRLGFDVIRNQNGTIRLPSRDTIDVNILDMMRQDISFASRARETTPSLRVQAQDALNWIDNQILGGTGAATRSNRVVSQYRRGAGAHTEFERMTEGTKFSNEGLPNQMALSERAALTAPERRAQTTGALYKTNEMIDDAAAKGQTGKLADTLLGTADKRTNFMRWTDDGAGHANPRLAEDMRTDLSKIGSREDTYKQLVQNLTKSSSTVEDATKQALMAAQQMGYSSKFSAAAALMRRAGVIGNSPARDYEVVRLMFDKTADGHQAIMREYARRLAKRAALPAKALRRSEIIHYLTQQTLASAVEPDLEQ